MQLSGEELKQVAEIAKKHPIIKKLLEELLSYDEDVSKLYYTTLSDAIRWVCHEIRNKTVDLEDPYTKTILKLAETGDKVFNTLQRGKADTQPVEGDQDKLKSLSKVRNIAT